MLWVQPPFLATDRDRLLAALFRSLVNEIHKLVELRRDDDLRAAVTLSAHSRVIAHERVELTTATGREALRRNVEMIDEILHHRTCTERGEIPVVTNVLHARS